MNVAMTPQKPQPFDHANFHANFAHEMANLLDGSLRNVALVMATLRDAQQHPSTTADLPSQDGAATQSPQSPEASAASLLKLPSPELINRLETANVAMQQMAQLVHQLLNQQTAIQSGTQAATIQPNASANPDLHTALAAVDALTLAQAMDHVLRLLKPLADQQHIALLVDIDPETQKLPAGPLFPVIVNAVRNSLQAIARTMQDGSPHDKQHASRKFVVQVHARVIRSSNRPKLQLTIQDNGPGLDPVTLDGQGRFQYGTTTHPQGHGLGLPLVRDIVQSLGGHLSIAGIGRNTPGIFSGTAPESFTESSHATDRIGTQLVVHIPLNRLANLIDASSFSPRSS